MPTRQPESGPRYVPHRLRIPVAASNVGSSTSSPPLRPVQLARRRRPAPSRKRKSGRCKVCGDLAAHRFPEPSGRLALWDEGYGTDSFQFVNLESDPSSREKPCRYCSFLWHIATAYQRDRADNELQVESVVLQLYYGKPASVVVSLARPPIEGRSRSGAEVRSCRTTASHLGPAD